MTAVKNIKQALEPLGVNENTLTSEEKLFLDKNGYLVLDNVMSESMLAGLREKYEELMKKEGKSAGTEVHQEAGTRRLSDLVNKGDIFDQVIGGRIGVTGSFMYAILFG